MTSRCSSVLKVWVCCKGTGGDCSCCTLTSFVCRGQNTFGNVWSSKARTSLEASVHLKKSTLLFFQSWTRNLFLASEESEAKLKTVLPSGCTEGPQCLFSTPCRPVARVSRGGTLHGTGITGELTHRLCSQRELSSEGRMTDAQHLKLPWSLGSFIRFHSKSDGLCYWSQLIPAESSFSGPWHSVHSVKKNIEHCSLGLSQFQILRAISCRLRIFWGEIAVVVRAFLCLYTGFLEESHAAILAQNICTPR
jgi:hypothetical protein